MNNETVKNTKKHENENFFRRALRILYTAARAEYHRAVFRCDLRVS